MKKEFTEQEAGDILKNIQQLVSMDDAEFARQLLSGLSAREIAEFQRECPEFPAELLPAKD